MSREHDVIHQELEGGTPAPQSLAESGNAHTEAEHSPKAHKEMPPREIEPRHEVQGHRRGETGQFTDKGAPGHWKK